MRLEISTVMLQWAAGGLAFCWVTTRRREVGLGFGWLLRGVYAAFAVIALAAGTRIDGLGAGRVVFLVSCGATALVALTGLAVSVLRRRAGVREQRARRNASQERVAAMVGSAVESGPAIENAEPEFPPGFDLAAACCAIVGILAAATIDGGPYALTLLRLLAGAALLGVASDAMLLGHWYLVQPGLRREPIRELVVLLAIVWGIEIVAFCWPTGMVSVLDGSIDDGYGGLLGWIWLASAITTIVLVGVTWLALQERSYSAVMAATGLLYLAILTAFGTDLVARALLSSG